ncbi:Gfo/Idh/MocA family protein [Urbifossiella limnaea]|uniref:1,5-anhydro-D-fructose reductase n=1 Tax=Urbifossiella limnaea TaxID=2528023 RepID=A0A517XN29_9BACT|nr:Gfo/Idh/MocA family oxidoreductase [Urbifossiella limnaea]QDU18914.1 1,5-anhydro-D-fructose reductase [Urbifossiella limnaea]
MRPRGVAVAGTGFIGPVHVEAVRRLGHRVVGVLGSTPAKGRAAADALGVPVAYDSLAALLADPAVEVVHLATPNRAHFAQAQAVLEAGKHVVVEKPLAMTGAETAELVRLAAARPGQVAAVNYNVRFYPLCLDARERVRAGEIGDVLHVTGSYLQDWLLYPTDFNWRVLAADGGDLRAVADIGTHWLDLVCFITGLEIEAVCADLRTVYPVRQKPLGGSETFTGSAGQGGESVAVTTEDYGSILLRFKGGARGCVTVSQVTAGRKNCLRFDLARTKVSLAWDSEEPNVLHVGHRGKSNECVGRDPGQLAAAARRFSDYPGGHAEGFPDSHKQLFRAAYAAIDGDAGPYPTFADGHREVVVCEAVLRSSRTGSWERVAE